MRITLERLRMWILLAGIILVLAIASFFVYARYRVRQFGHDLPQKLGLEIQQSTNGFTVSRSHAGHTQFVLHASKAVQYKNGGHLVLHDVSILMYGKDGTRADRISGSQFDYDQSAEIARADGSVDIELASPVSGAGHGGGSSSKPAGTVRVKTSGLVFNQKTQVASTEQPLVFQDGAASGSAKGATYDSANGTLDLASDVVLNSTVNDEAVNIKAQSATFNRALRQLVLIKSLTEYQQEHVTADQATVFFKEGGSADHVTAQNNVHLVTDTGTDLKSNDAYAQLDEQSKLQLVRLNGGVLLIVHREKADGGSGESDQQTLHADSNSANLSFRQNKLEHLQMLQAVSAVDQQVGLPDDPHGSETREMRAAKLDVNFELAADGRSEAKSALASGEALVTVHTIHAATPQQSTTLKGDQLFVTLVNGHQLSSLRGDGHTYLLQTSPGGVSQTGSSDVLTVKFAPRAAVAVKPADGRTKRKTAIAGGLVGKGSRSQIESALQQGHAVLAQLQPASNPAGPPVKTTATADSIAYDGAAETISLSGGTPRIQQGSQPGSGDQENSELTADAIVFNRNTGDAIATGGVKATYAKSQTSAPAALAMHVVAERAALDKPKDETTFTGGLHADARLWQGANSITAPVIVLARTRQLLTAKGPGGAVKTVFAESKSLHGKAGGTAAGPSVMRIASDLLTYSGGERKATFNGNIAAQGEAGSLHAASLDVYLTAAQAASAAGQGKTGSNGMPGPAGQIDRIVASGRVDFQQGDRRATGDKLVYTAEDEHFVLTGTGASPPRVTDPVHGSVTGSSLIFNNRDDSVIVSRGQSATVTDTHTPK